MLLGRRYRLDLDREQIDYAERVGGICRSVWNAALDQRRVAAQLNRGGRHSAFHRQPRSVKWCGSAGMWARCDCLNWEWFASAGAGLWAASCATLPCSGVAATGTSLFVSRMAYSRWPRTACQRWASTVVWSCLWPPATVSASVSSALVYLSG